MTTAFNTRILTAIKRIDTTSRKSDRKGWTRFVLSVFSQACPSTCQPYSSRDRRHPEYLVDLVWSYPNERGKWLPWSECRGLALAMECEWNGSTNGFWEDFIKLADVRADARVFLGHLHKRAFREYSSTDGAFHHEIQRFLKRHRHFSAKDSIIVALWSYGGNQPLLVREYRKRSWVDLPSI